jgi:hypothetical protein
MVNYWDISYWLTIWAWKWVQRNSADNAFEAVYTNPDYYKYSIVPSLESWDVTVNLKVALKNYLWDDPSAAAPVKIQIGGNVLTIAGAMSATLLSWEDWENYFNLWSSELVDKDVDLFVYIWDTTALFGYPVLMVSRIPYWNTVDDFNQTVTNEKAIFSDEQVWDWTTAVTNIWRLTAHFLESEGYFTWVAPTYDLIINRPIFETRKLEYVPQFSWSVLSWYNNAYYQIISNRMYVWFNAENKIFSSWSWEAEVSLPFTPNETIPKIIYTLWNSSARANNTFMAQINWWKINFWQWNWFDWFAWTETAVYLKFDDTLPLT